MTSLHILVGVRALLFTGCVILGKSVLSEPWVPDLCSGKIDNPPHRMQQKLHKSVSESNF